MGSFTGRTCSIHWVFGRWPMANRTPEIWGWGSTGWKPCGGYYVGGEYLGKPPQNGLNKKITESMSMDSMIRCSVFCLLWGDMYWRKLDGQVLMHSHLVNVTVDGWNPANQLRLVVYPFIPLFIGFHLVSYIPGGDRRISAINSMISAIRTGSPSSSRCSNVRHLVDFIRVVWLGVLGL